MFSLTRTLTPRLVSTLINTKANQSLLIQPLRASLSSSAVRFSSDDEMLTVGPWPRTKEERLRAAKKYNLIPEDYIPFPEDEALGDYPNLKAIGKYNLDKYDDYDDPVDYKFYGEVYHINDDMYLWERHDPLQHEKPQPKFWVKFAFCFGPITVITIFYYLIRRYDLNINHPWKQRKYFPNRIFYDFPSSGSH